MKKRSILSILIIILLLFPMTSVLAVENPYGNLGYGDCTWTAWQLAYERLGIALPRWGYANDWCYGANASGYPTGTVPQANAIVVWDGHVGFVAQTSGNNIYVLEGGYDSSGSGYHEGWYDGTAGSINWGMPLIGYVYLADVPPNCTPVKGVDSASEMARRNQELAALQIKKASLENQIMETQGEIDRLNTELETGKNELGKIMCARYMVGEDSYLSYLFTSQNISDFFTKISQVSQIISAENERMNAIQKKVDELKQRSAELDSQKAELEAMTI